MRIRIAAMLAEIGVIVDPDSIHQNQDPCSRRTDMCRWCVDGTKDGRFIHVCSWSRMGDIIKSGKLGIVDDDYLTFEVCEGG